MTEKKNVPAIRPNDQVAVRDSSGTLRPTPVPQQGLIRSKVSGFMARLRAETVNARTEEVDAHAHHYQAQQHLAESYEGAARAVAKLSDLDNTLDEDQRARDESRAVAQGQRDAEAHKRRLEKERQQRELEDEQAATMLRRAHRGHHRQLTAERHDTQLDRARTKTNRARELREFEEELAPKKRRRDHDLFDTGDYATLNDLRTAEAAYDARWGDGPAEQTSTDEQRRTTNQKAEGLQLAIDIAQDDLAKAQARGASHAELSQLHALLGRLFVQLDALKNQPT